MVSSAWRTPRVARALVRSTNASIIASRTPSAGATSENGTVEIRGSRKMGAGFTRAPGPSPVFNGAMGCIRCGGTNASAITMSLLPVPARPVTNQVSSISQSLRGSRK